MVKEIEELKKVMEEKNLSKDVIARVCEISWQTVNRWLKGENEPSYIYRKILRNALTKLRNIH